MELGSPMGGGKTESKFCMCALGKCPAFALKELYIYTQERNQLVILNNVLYNQVSIMSSFERMQRFITDFIIIFFQHSNVGLVFDNLII